MTEDAVLFSGSSFCFACATATAAVSSAAAIAAADVKAATAASGSSYYCSAAADAETASANTWQEKRGSPLGFPRFVCVAWLRQIPQLTNPFLWFKIGVVCCVEFLLRNFSYQRKEAKRRMGGKL